MICTEYYVPKAYIQILMVTKTWDPDYYAETQNNISETNTSLNTHFLA